MLTQAAFSSVVAVALAAVCWVGALDSSVAKLGAISLPLSLFVLNAFQLNRRRASASTTSSPTWAFGALAALLIAGILGASWLVVVFQLAGLGLFAVTLKQWVSSRIRRVNALGLVAFTVLLGGWAATIAWNSGDPDLWILQRLPGGIAGIDGLQFTSIAAMIRTYGVPSLGLDGVPYVSYHFGSMWVVAQLAHLLHAPTVLAYNVVFPIVFVPLFLSMLIGFSLEYASWVRPDGPVGDPADQPAYWLLLVFVLVGALPFSIGRALGLWATNPLHIQSYMLALAAGLGTCAWLLRSRRFSRPDDSLTDHLVWLILILTLASLKVSVGALLAGVRTYVIMRGRWFSARAIGAALVVVVVLAACVVLFGRLSFDITQRPAVPVLDTNAHGLTLHNLIGGTLLSLCVALVGVLTRMRSESSLWQVVRTGRLLDVELLMLTATLGLAPALLLVIPGGSNYYFWNVQTWVALAMLLGLIVAAPQLAGINWVWALRPLARAVLVVVVIAGSLGVLRNSYWHVRYFVEARARWQALEQDARLEPARLLLKTLMEIEDWPTEEKRQSLLYVPADNHLFWGMSRDCYAVGSVAPALSGMAALDGWRSGECDDPLRADIDVRPIVSTYLDRRHETSATVDALCSRAEGLGFQRVVFLNDAEHVDRVDCANSAVRKEGPLQ